MLPLDMHCVVAIIAKVNSALFNNSVDIDTADGHTAEHSGNQLGLAKRKSIAIGACRCATQAWAGRVHALEFQYRGSGAHEKCAALLEPLCRWTNATLFCERSIALDW
jgi:hypothetical protein